MNPQIRHAQRACEAAKARQAVVVWFDEHGQHAVASYGETKAECTAVKPRAKVCPRPIAKPKESK